MPRVGGSKWRKYALSFCLVASGLTALHVIQMQNFLLFHSIVEIFSIVMAFSVFLVTWNARKEIENSFILIVGISYLFVGGLDLLHTLAYEGMGVFPDTGANLPTQLWIFGRYLESVSFLGAATVGVVSNERQIVASNWNDRQLLTLITGFAVVVGLGLSSIFVFDVFPEAYVAGSGLTDIKVFSEYLIVALLAFGLVLLYQQRGGFDERVSLFLVASILLTMGAELAFTFYVDVYGFSNAIGHFFKLASFYLIYLAVVKTGFTEPTKTLYRELAQREAEARKFEKAADYSGHAIMITDREGKIQYVNEAWEEMTGYSVAEAVGESPKILRSGEHDEEFYEELRETILAGGVWEGKITNKRANGEHFVIHQTVAPISRAETGIQGFVAVHDEITEQVQYEEQLESDLRRSVQQLEVLARVLRHNIRNEMNVVQGNAGMVQEITSDEEIEQLASVIEKKSDGLLTLAEKQREIVKLLLEPLTPTSLELPETIDSVVDRLRQQYPQAEITVESPSKLQITTLPELEQAIEEVIENAIIHNDQERLDVVIRVQSVDQMVQIQITDNGRGIPPAEKQVVTGKTEIDALLHGSGMGLWLVDHIVTKVGGTVHFDDAEPRGNTVSLVIPQDQVEQANLREATEQNLL